MNAPFEIQSMPRIKRLNEKALIVQLKTGRPRLSRRDKQAEDLIRDTYGDDSYTAYSKLFKSPHNPVSQLMQEINAVYSYHTKHTFPSTEKGSRILGVHSLDDYKAAIRDMIESVNRRKAALLPNYDSCVQQDINERTAHAQATGKATTVSVNEYPTMDEFDARTFLQLRVLPLPDAAHFLFDADQSDIDSISNYIADIESAVRVDTVKRLFDPVKHLIEKVSQPLEKGRKFHDSTYTNAIDAVQAFKEMNISDDPQLSAMVTELDTELKRYNIEWLKQSPVMRDQARTNLDAIANKMAAFF